MDIKIGIHQQKKKQKKDEDINELETKLRYLNKLTESSFYGVEKGISEKDYKEKV